MSEKYLFLVRAHVKEKAKYRLFKNHEEARKAVKMLKSSNLNYDVSYSIKRIRIEEAT